MADLTFANLVDIAENIAKRVAGIEAAATVVEADIDAQFTRYQGFNDDTGIGSDLAGACIPQKALLDKLRKGVAQIEMAKLAAAFQNADTTPTDGGGDKHDTVDSFFADGKSAMTNPLLANEFAVQFRDVNGDASLSAANCSAATGTSYGDAEITGATAVTLTVVDDPVDTDLYAGGVLECKVTTIIASAGGTGDTVLTLTGKTLSGSTWVGTCDLPHGHDTDDPAVEVTPAIAKTYPVELTSATVANGASGAVNIRVKQPYTYTQ